MNFEERKTAVEELTDGLTTEQGAAFRAYLEYSRFLSTGKISSNDKVAIYCRHSCDDMALEKQVSEVKDCAEKAGASEITIFKDIARAHGDKQPGLDRMLQTIRDDTIDCVFVKSRSRFSDEPDVQVSIAQQIIGLGSKLYEME